MARKSRFLPITPLSQTKTKLCRTRQESAGIGSFASLPMNTLSNSLLNELFRADFQVDSLHIAGNAPPWNFLNHCLINLYLSDSMCAWEQSGKKRARLISINPALLTTRFKHGLSDTFIYSRD